MPKDIPTIKKLSQGRVECTVTFTPEETAAAEQKALAELGQQVNIEGFRPGKAPAAMVKEKVNPDGLFEEVIRHALPGMLPNIAEENKLQPIIPPKVEAVSREPLTVKITFVERPPVKVKKGDKITVEKKETKVSPEEIQKMIDYVLQQQQTSTEVDRAAKEGDRVTMDFWGEDETKQEIAGARMTDRPFVIGSKSLIPGFEDALIGTKKGEQKSFPLTFPENYHAENLKGKPATFHVTVKKVEEIATPELTDAFAKEHFDAASVDDFKKRVETSMKSQEEQIEKERRQQALFDAIRAATDVDLAPELIEDEQRGLIEELGEQLAQQNKTIEDWIKQQQKDVKAFLEEMKQRATQRLTLRFGMQQLLEDRDVQVTDEEMEQEAKDFLSQLSDEEQKQMAPLYVKGGRNYEQMKWQKRMEKLVDQMLS